MKRRTLLGGTIAVQVEAGEALAAGREVGGLLRSERREQEEGGQDGETDTATFRTRAWHRL